MRDLSHRRIPRTAPPQLLPILPDAEGAQQTLVVPLGSMSRASAEELLSSISEQGASALTRKAAGDLLDRLAEEAGDTWHERWNNAVEEGTTSDRGWLVALLGRTFEPYQATPYYQALRWLISFDALRPSYGWMTPRRLQFWADVGHYRDPDAWAQFCAHVNSLGLVPIGTDSVLICAGQLVAHTGKSIRHIEANDVLAMARTFSDSRTASRKRLPVTWRALRELGWLESESVRMPSLHQRLGPMTCEQLVDRYTVSEPQRSVLVHYLRARKTALDYTSLSSLAWHLVGLFWSDVERHCGPLPGFALSESQADEWKQRLRHCKDGTPRKDYKAILNAVRAFYTDIAIWAQHDSYWTAWVAPSFIYAHDTAGMKKDRRRTVSEQHHRIRQIAPVLPQIVAAAERQLASARAALESAAAAGDGGEVTIDGRSWRVMHPHPQSHVRGVCGNDRVDLTDREDAAFWTWAGVEVLHHSGVRIEELLELTHLSLQPHTVKQTGEVLPLLHITPSKTDEERLLVAGPELAHALAQIISRIRDLNGRVPLVQRYDTYEHTWSEPLPFLFQGRSKGGPATVISPGGMRKLILGLVGRADITVAGRPIKLTPHDFRRIFATDALASGMPPHIIQQLLGHKSIATTQGYAAIYPEHTMRQHQAFIASRRDLRPGEEYREPTSEEWAEFERHFVTRRVELGTCGRAYGTGCRHEHACIRCSLLRPDPAQSTRLRGIIDNLTKRIAEAETNGWLGEVEGLRTSILAARQKLDQMDAVSNRLTKAADLPMPVIRLTAP